MENPIKVSEKLFLVIEILSEKGSIGLIELSEILKMHKSTTHRLLKSLIYMDYVKQDKDNGKYSLTFKLVKISNNILKHIDILDVVRPYLKKLSDQTMETVHLVKYSDNEAIYIDKVESYQNSVRMVSKVGKIVPMYCSAVGKVLAANMKIDEVKQLWNTSEIKHLTKYTITDFSKYKKEVDEAVKTGYALDNEENELGVRCIAVAFHDYNMKYCYALSISAPVSRMTDKRIQELADFLKDVKEDIEKDMLIKI